VSKKEQKVSIEELRRRAVRTPNTYEGIKAVEALAALEHFKVSARDYFLVISDLRCCAPVMAFIKDGNNHSLIGLVTCSWSWSQLTRVVKRHIVEVFGDELDKDAVNIVKNGLDNFRKQDLDVIIIDTAGRHKEEKGLLDEMKSSTRCQNPTLCCP
jgi:hypothetical protein